MRGVALSQSARIVLACSTGNSLEHQRTVVSFALSWVIISAFDSSHTRIYGCPRTIRYVHDHAPQANPSYSNMSNAPPTELVFIMLVFCYERSSSYILPTSSSPSRHTCHLCPRWKTVWERLLYLEFPSRMRGDEVETSCVSVVRFEPCLNPHYSDDRPRYLSAGFPEYVLLSVSETCPPFHATDIDVESLVDMEWIGVDWSGFHY